jgi:epoxide hydrolase A/B
LITAELDPAQIPPSGMDALAPNLTKHPVGDCGHWTPEEKSEKVSATIIDWRRRALGG